jgi:lysophospholipase L1-like esterase
MPSVRSRAALICLAFFCVVAAPADAVAVQSKRPAPLKWIGTWASAQQIPEPRNALDPSDLRDATLRQIVHLTIGGDTLRLRLSNVFGTAPLHIASVHIALPTSRTTGSIDATTDTPVTFAGAPDITIPAGADYLSDPVAFKAAPRSDLAVTFYIDTPPSQQTSHPGARETSFLVHGNQVSAATLADAKTFDHWFNLSGVDVEAPAQAFAIITLGDSITDGRGSTTNGDDRWPDALADRLQASPATRTVSVLNVGMGGNRILLDQLGPSAISRIDRDVLAQPGARWLIVFEGINDLGVLSQGDSVTPADHAALVRDMIAAYGQIVLRAHAQGLKVIGATITPDMGFESYRSETIEADRQAINQWIRTSNTFDAVVDFDQIVRDPANPEHLAANYDCGDHLHMTPDAYRAMAAAIPLALFAPPPAKAARPRRPTARISRTARSK